MEAWRDELYHHGIEKQRWGVRHGPPYPLDPEDHSPAQRRAAGGLFKKMAERRAEKKKKAKQQERVKKMQAAKKKKDKENKKRERIVKEGSMKEVLKAKGLSPDELRYARTRLSEEDQLRAMNDRQTQSRGIERAERGIEKAEKLVSYARRAGKMASDASDTVDNVVKAVNTGIGAYNWATGSNLKKISFKAPSIDDLIKQEQYKQNKLKTETDTYNKDFTKWRWEETKKHLNHTDLKKE